jgi:hypothetical protein
MLEAAIQIQRLTIVNKQNFLLFESFSYKCIHCPNEKRSSYRETFFAEDMRKNRKRFFRFSSSTGN